MNQPHIIPIDETRYKLEHEYTYESGNNKIIVPSGFIYDGASVPQCMWSITGLRPDGLIRASALIHDWMYSREVTYKGNFHKIPDGSELGYSIYTRKSADKLFHQIMLEAGMSKTKARLAYWAVRLFGWMYW